MKRKTVICLTLAAANIACMSETMGEVIARYNFNKRVNSSEAVRRDKVDGALTEKDGMKFGPVYVPNKEHGESGVALENPFAKDTVPQNYYRSYYLNDNGRDVLKLGMNHVFNADRYISMQDADGKGIIPEKGPFAIEFVLCIYSCRGVTSGKDKNIAVVIDLSVDKSDEMNKKYLWTNKLFACNYNKAKQSYDLALLAGKNAAGHSNRIDFKELNVGEYYHIALVFEQSGGVKLYVDGKVAGETHVPVDAQRNSKFGINANTASGSSPGLLVGNIDELVIHNTTLQPENFALSIPVK